MISLLFDMDGCLIDSLEVQKAAFFGSYALVVGDDKCPSFEEYMKFTGDSVDNVFRKMGLPAEMAPIYREISENSNDKIHIYWDAINIIRELRKIGVKVAICTGKDHYRAEAILKYFEIEPCFDVIIGAEDVTYPKPSPEPILRALDCLKSDKADAVLIGDGYNDILSAKRAGVRSILTLWYGNQSVPREADYTVSNVEELKTVLSTMFTVLKNIWVTSHERSYL